MPVDYTLLALAAYRSKISYMAPDAMNTLWLGRANLDKNSLAYHVFDDVYVCPKYYYDSVSGAVAYSWLQRNVLYIVFRGTQGAQDVRIDIDELRAPLFDGRNDLLVHEGFLKQFTALKSGLLETIESVLDVVSQIHFCGHSLGGALATLAAGVFSLRWPKLVSCYTFGSPRVGGGGFVKWWDELTIPNYRIFNYRDPVPMIPINWFYKHIYGGLRLNDDGGVTVVGHDSWFFGRIIYCLCHISCCYPIYSHGCDVYITRLLTLAGDTMIK